MNRTRSLALLSLSFASLSLAQLPEKDTVQTGEDHPLISRYEGSVMVAYAFREFDEVELPTGPVAVARKWEKSDKLEGKWTRIAYNYAKERSSLEVMRNYQAALAKAGLKTIFACEKQACGARFGDVMLDTMGTLQFPGSSRYWSPFNYGRTEPRYTLAKAQRTDGSVAWAAVYVVPPTEGYNGGVYLQIVEMKAMDSGKVSADVSAGQMAAAITGEGRVAIYGVFFDTGQAEVLPTSKPALAEMAKLLKEHAELRVYIVGHTDNTGTLARNLELSEQRAKAVVKALVEQYQCDARRLDSKGVASFAPVASNDDEAGRARNRRVELVKQ